MSILIKGMEMPTSCWECHFGHGDTGICVVDFKSHGDWNEPQDCPLVPVPPHGDLVDKHTLIDGILYELGASEAIGDKEEYAHWERVLTYVRKSPTIIPAEEGE